MVTHSLCRRAEERWIILPKSHKPAQSSSNIRRMDVKHTAGQYVRCLVCQYQLHGCRILEWSHGIMSSHVAAAVHGILICFVVHGLSWHKIILYCCYCLWYFMAWGHLILLLLSVVFHGIRSSHVAAAAQGISWHKVIFFCCCCPWHSMA